MKGITEKQLGIKNGKKIAKESSMKPFLIFGLGL
jgi:hypothetical protein